MPGFCERCRCTLSVRDSRHLHRNDTLPAMNVALLGHRRQKRASSSKARCPWWCGIVYLARRIFSARLMRDADGT
jgi:hypothetical protein